MTTQNKPQFDREGERATFKPGGNLTAAAAPELRSMLKTMVAEGVRYLVVDLTEVDVVDSSGIGLLVAAHNSLSRLGGEMTVIHVSADLVDLFKSFRLDKHFSISS